MEAGMHLECRMLPSNIHYFSVPYGWEFSVQRETGCYGLEVTVFAQKGLVLAYANLRNQAIDYRANR